MNERDEVRNRLLGLFTAAIMRQDAKALRHVCHALAAALTDRMTVEQMREWFGYLEQNREGA